MSFTRFASSAALTCAALAVALPGCSSDQPEPGIGNLDMAVTLAQPPAGPNEQIDTVDVELYCDGVDPILGVPRPPMSDPEEFTINVSTSQGPEPYNTIGLLEKQGLPAGNCTLKFNAVSNTGNTECTGEITVPIVTDQTTLTEVVLACIHTPRYGGLRTDGTFNQCAEYRQILVTPTTQSIGNLVDIATEVYDPDGDAVTVQVTTSGACGNVATIGSDTAASCETVSGCETVVNTVECTGVGLCEISVALSDDNFTSCTGFLPDGSNNNAARRTIAVDCTVAAGCGNGILEPGEDCDPPDGVFCDQNCQFIDNCSPDPCDQSNVCSPEVCSADPNTNAAICTPDPGSAAGVMCSPPAGGTCDGQGNCAQCTVDNDCDDMNECTDNACVAGACEFTNNNNQCTTTGGFPGTCSAGVCGGLCDDVTCPDNGIECVTDVCNPANGGCEPTNDGINTGCDLGGAPGVCDGAGACVECNIDAQCGAGETCVNNVCEGAALVCEYEQDFEALDPADPDALGNDGWLYFGNVYDSGGVFKFGFGPFAAPTVSGQISGIATGEGGPDQGSNQLVVFSNYDCCQPGEGHFNGTDLVETIVFQEINPIPADLIGKVFTFQFDAKRGNIEGTTTAQAFIRTLDPSAGFATTNNIPLDTTNLPTDWGTYSISIDLSDPALEGQILQFGFSTIASNFQGAGNFYDNISFCTDAGAGGCSVDADCPDTGNDCTAGACVAGNCETVNVADGTSCDGGTGTCSAGVCEPTGTVACLYEQDFNQLDAADGGALTNDGWLVFGNVFDSGGGFLFGYGPFGAPNGGPGFSAIVGGQGGPDQEPQQLSIYNNYDCCQPSNGHFNGTDLSQALVFQEIASIPAGLIGQVLTFTFDAKNGDIQPPTTAQAYIQTLDPGAGFAQTNFIPLDMTNIGTDWSTYSISIDLSDPLLEGQILQFGFSSTASNFTPSQNVYDNVKFGVDGCGGGGGGPGPGGELTINGDFEAGDTSGWEFIPNDGTFAAVASPNNGGSFAGNLVASVPAGGGPPSFPVIKQANLGVGSVQPNSSCDISFDLFGSVSGAGGVFFAEFFSELTGGGTSSSVILGGGPLFPNGTWTTYSYTTPTGPDVSGGVTLQLKTDCGANPGCTVDAFIDNVSVICP